MLTVVALKTAIGDDKDPIVAEIDWTGRTIAELIQDYRRDDWDPGAEVVATLNGGECSPEHWNRVAPNDCQLVLFPRPHWTLVLNIAVELIISAAVYYIASLLAPKPDQPNVPVQQDDIASPVARWDRITSTYRQGYPIPLAYGERNVGGTVLEAQMTALGVPTETSVYVVLGLCAGRIEAIGGNTGGTYGEVNNLNGTAFPTNVRVDGNLIESIQDPSGQNYSATADLRMGDDQQGAVPNLTTSTTLPVSGELNDQGQQVITTISATVSMMWIECTIEAPAGCYQVDAQGNYKPNPVQVETGWRYLGETQWRSIRGHSLWPNQVRRARDITSLFVFIISSTQQPITGPVEVLIRRLTKPLTAVTAVNALNLVNVAYRNEVGQFSYPGVAHIALTFLNSEKLSNARPNFSIRLKGTKVRVYDATIGSNLPSTERFYELPPSTSSYTGIWSYPPGKNPAWITTDLLTREDALGSQRYTDSEIDWEAFRDWADFCDSHVLVSGGNEAAFQCDIVFDSPNDALMAILHVMSAGRARPVLRGRKFSVKYEYADAHGRGTNSVPAKTRAFLISSANVKDFRVEYMNVEKRPAVINVQFPDADKDYVWDVEPVEDPNGGFNDPRTFEPLGVTKVAQQLRGVTRRSQARREGLFMHAANRLITSRVSFTAGPDTLAAEIGDVIGVEHISMSPYDEDSYGYRLQEEATTASVKIDHQVVLLGGKTYAVIVREKDGGIVERTVTAGAGVYAAGTAISISASIDAYRSAPIAIGVQEKVVVDYVIRKISLDALMFRKVEAPIWNPDVYSMVDVGESIGDATPPVGTVGTFPIYFDAPDTAENAYAIDVEPMASSGGRHLVTWATQQSERTSPGRAFARGVAGRRALGQPGFIDAGAWFPLGEGANQVETEALTPNEQYEIAIALRRIEGVWQDVNEAERVTVFPGEFPRVPPPSIRRLSAIEQGKGVLLTWQRIDSALLRYYEIRAGSEWISGHRIARTTETSYLVLDPMPGLAYMVRARTAAGLYSREITSVAAPVSDWAPDDSTAITETDLSAFPGTLSNLTYNAGTGELSISTGEFGGTWTTATIDAGYSVDMAVLFRYLPRYDHPQTIAEVIAESGDFGVQSGEALWRTLAGREASPFSHGLEFRESIADLDGPISTITEERGAMSYLGDVGKHVRHFVEVQYDGGSWEEWTNATRRVHQTVAFRVSLDRRDLNRNIYLTDAKVWQYA